MCYLASEHVKHVLHHVMVAIRAGQVHASVQSN